MFLLNNLEMDYEPYPIGIIKPVIEEGLYRELLASYPPLELFQHMQRFGEKYSLSDKWNPKNYYDFVRRTPAWREVFDYIKSDDFIYSVADLLRARGIDLGFTRKSQRFGNRLGKAALNLVRGRMPITDAPIVSRFEFSVLPADGGIVIPHTDAPRKLITLVFSMADEDEWDIKAGGGTEVLVPKDVARSYNFYNAQIPYDEVETRKVFEFEPNQAVVFIKTYNSLHGVRKMAGPKDMFRRTLTINLLRKY